jgi:hypothetical protein
VTFSIVKINLLCNKKFKKLFLIIEIVAKHLAL